MCWFALAAHLCKHWSRLLDFSSQSEPKPLSVMLIIHLHLSSKGPMKIWGWPKTIWRSKVTHATRYLFWAWKHPNLGIFDHTLTRTPTVCSHGDISPMLPHTNHLISSPMNDVGVISQHLVSEGPRVSCHDIFWCRQDKNLELSTKAIVSGVDTSDFVHLELKNNIIMCWPSWQQIKAKKDPFCLTCPISKCAMAWHWWAINTSWDTIIPIIGPFRVIWSCLSATDMVSWQKIILTLFQIAIFATKWFWAAKWFQPLSSPCIHHGDRHSPRSVLLTDNYTIANLQIASNASSTPYQPTCSHTDIAPFRVIWNAVWSNRYGVMAIHNMILGSGLSRSMNQNIWHVPQLKMCHGLALMGHQYLLGHHNINHWSI
jgi:hypothetical protein